MSEQVRQNPSDTTAVSPAVSKTEAELQKALLLHQRGQLLDAEQIYRSILTSVPDHFDAIHLLGVALIQRRELAAGEQLIARAVKIDPNDPSALCNWGNALRELKRAQDAVISYDRAIALKPNYAEAFYGRGNALRDLRRFDEALASYDKAIALTQTFADAFNNRGIALAELKRFAEALASYDRAIILKPAFAEAFNNRGNALRDLRRFEEAVASYDRAIGLKPTFAEAFNNRGIALRELRRFEEALASYNKAIELKPDYAEAFNNLGATLWDTTRFDDALASYNKAIELQPDFLEARLNLAGACMEQGHQPEAALHYEQALSLKRDLAPAKFGLCMAQLPVVYMDEAEIAECRAAYQEHLEALNIEATQHPGAWAKSIGSSPPFLLAYQGRNDCNLQRIYGSLICRIISDNFPAAAMPPPPAPGERVRVGVVSGMFRDHTVWKLMIKGWLSQLDRSKFQVFGYHTGSARDACTVQAAAVCDRFVQGPLPFDRWREEILADHPHILLYPDIGMDSMAAWVAADRLAPTQCVTWGHPNTTGYPTIDYFLSSALMEPPDGEQHYTERLVRLPNLSIYYEPPDPRPVSTNRPQLGLRESAVVYWCGQSLFKYLPQFDEVFPRIARDVGDCQFVFIQFPRGTYVTERFRERLDHAFTSHGLRVADYCVFLPPLQFDRFIAAVGLCDVVLDSIGWSGGNSTLEGLHHDLPIVTIAGPLMRGRHTMAILKMIDVEDTVTTSVDGYVSTAVRLGRDAVWRMALKNKISRNKTQVYRDASCILALEDFLNSVARRPNA